jgi:spore germination protein GerM
MSVTVKEFKPEDTMAEMDMERALAKLKLGPKKDPNELLDEFASIKCQYLLELSKSKKKVQVLRLSEAQYSSIISTTSMIHREIRATLTTEILLDEMHLQ